MFIFGVLHFLAHSLQYFDLTKVKIFQSPLIDVFFERFLASLCEGSSKGS
jgi:hypothetical protein